MIALGLSGWHGKARLQLVCLFEHRASPSAGAAAPLPTLFTTHTHTCAHALSRTSSPARCITCTTAYGDLLAMAAVNVLNLFISVGLSSAAASLGELGKAVGALERVAELVAPNQAAAAAARSSNSSEATRSSSSSCSGSSGSDGGSGSSTASSPTAAAPPTASSSGRVEFKDVWFKYPGATDWAVRGLNITFLPGQVGAWGGRQACGARRFCCCCFPARCSFNPDPVSALASPLCCIF